jgi:hypothetical protein
MILVDNEQLKFTPFEFCIQEVSIVAPELPVSVIEHHLRQVVSEVARKTDLFSKIFTINLPPWYTDQEVYTLQPYFGLGTLKTILSVRTNTEDKPYIMTTPQPPEYFAVHFKYPSSFYIFNRPRHIKALQVYASYDLSTEEEGMLEGVPSVLYKKYRDVLLDGFFYRWHKYHGVSAGGALTQQNMLTYKQLYETGLTRIKADLINEAHIKPIIMRSKLKL